MTFRRCSETRPAVQLHFRRTDVVLGARVVLARIRRRHHATFRARGLRVERRRGVGSRGRRRARGGRGRSGAASAGQHDGRPAGLRDSAADAGRGPPDGGVRVQFARHQRPRVDHRLPAEPGRQADHIR